MKHSEVRDMWLQERQAVEIGHVGGTAKPADELTNGMSGYDAGALFDIVNMKSEGLGRPKES
jgi:hypothetical protein